ncbi:hypothetical protein [Edwardsiella tarda]|uniref:hypothetical protein n=1 Tax=Edwardsiella tarda TaxID=636 RepID=UPI00083B8CBA|nr:hypothetical protein [Edwardsiella tarda]
MTITKSRGRPAVYTKDQNNKASALVTVIGAEMTALVLDMSTDAVIRASKGQKKASKEDMINFVAGIIDHEYLVNNAMCEYHRRERLGGIIFA